MENKIRELDLQKKDRQCLLSSMDDVIRECNELVAEDINLKAKMTDMSFTEEDFNSNRTLTTIKFNDRIFSKYKIDYTTKDVGGPNNSTTTVKVPRREIACILECVQGNEPNTFETKVNLHNLGL
jgi:hypothetical protein